MSCKMLFFDFRETEKHYFETHNFDNFEIKFFKEGLNEETVNNLSEEDLNDTMIISVFITSHITPEVIDKFKNLRIIATRSTGYDHIDTKICVDKNIALINVEKYGNTSVAQFTFTLILALIRKLFPAVEAVKTRSCIDGGFTGRNLDTLVLGIIGTGAIGAGVCAIAHGFGMKILAFDPSPKKELEKKYKVQYVDMDNLLEQSDIVTLHLPYNEENYHMISGHSFKKMKENSYFINVSRGELVNLEDLLKYIKNGKICGAGLDVVACLDSSCMDDANRTERSSLLCLEESKIVQELNSMPNVIITPHMAYDTQESVDYILEKSFEGLMDYIYGGNKFRVL